MKSRKRREECLMRPSCAASSASFTHSIRSQPSFFIWPNINFTSFFLSLFLISLFFSSLPHLFLSCRFPFPFCRPIQRTNRIRLNQFKNYNSLTGDRQSLCWLSKVSFRTRASQFSNYKENPTGCKKEPDVSASAVSRNARNYVKLGW